MVRERRTGSESDAHPVWITTFCDFAFLLLTFSVLQFSMTAPRIIQTEPKEETKAPLFGVDASGDTTVIIGAFSPSDGTELSFRGKTAIDSLALRARELEREVVVSVQPAVPVQEAQNELMVNLLLEQRESILRQLIDAGVPLDHLAVAPPVLQKAQSITLEKGAKYLSSRLEITLQEKRT